MATASRAIGGVQTVAPELSRRVFAAAERLGYRMSAAARVTAVGYGSIVGLVGDDTSDPYFATLAGGVAELAAERGCILMMAGCSHGADLGNVLHSLIGFRPRAIVIASRDVVVEDLRDDAVLDQYRGDRGGIATVGTGARWAPAVNTADALGSAQLADVIRERGYRRPLILSPPARFPSAVLRAECLRAAVSGWAAEARTVEADGLDRDAGYRTVNRVTSGSKPSFDIILAVGDMLAIGAISALRDAGITPGRDVGVSGFDDLQPACDVVPGLTSVHTSLRHAGRHALDLAFGQDSGTGAAVPPPSVRVRGSTPVRQAGFSQ